jgi:hypothetical protein
MKTWFVCGLVSCVVVASLGCKADPTAYAFTDGGSATPAAKGETLTLDLEASALGRAVPPEFAQVLGTWNVEEENGHRFIAQVGELEEPDFPRLLARGKAFRNVHVKVRCSMRAGDTDRACGLMWRAKDSDNYYVARANALEDSVNVYRVVANDRQQFGGKSLTVTSNVWHTLEAFMEGAHIRVLWDGQEVVSADDATFPDGGKVGVWTKADSVTAFDDLEATEL